MADRDRQPVNQQHGRLSRVSRNLSGFLRVQHSHKAIFPRISACFGPARNIIATAWGLRRGPSARRFGPSRRPRVAMEVNPAPLPSCTSSPSKSPGHHPFVCSCTNSRPGHPRRAVTETAQVADEPHAQTRQRGRTAGAATSPDFSGSACDLPANGINESGQ